VAQTITSFAANLEAVTDAIRYATEQAGIPMLPQARLEIITGTFQRSWRPMDILASGCDAHITLTLGSEGEIVAWVQ
jgi:hypothetical protein